MAKDFDNDELERERPSDEPEVAALSDLGDYEVAEGYPDPRGWTVRASDGAEVGKVHDLIVDTGTMRTRYLDIRLSDDIAGASGERDVLVPIGTARVDDHGDSVIVNNLTSDRFASLPPYERGSFSRDHEANLRSHFTGGDAMSAGTIGAGATGGSDFYDHDHFDDRSFFARRGNQPNDTRDMRDARDTGDIGRTGNENERLTVSEEQLQVGKRQVSAGEVGVRKNVETRHVEQEVPLMREEVTVERRPINADSARGSMDAQITDDEIRVPVMREEAVIEKRLVPTEEIIIRKTAVRDTETVGADLRRERVEVDKGAVGRTRDNLSDRVDDDRTNAR
jgi:uncharacterized protein (TIGR02271 family)